MGDALLDRRLSTLGSNFQIDNDRITHQRVGPNSRATMSYIFGGDRARMVCYPAVDRRQVHGFLEPFLFPKYDFNPLLPARIGECGIFFGLDKKLEEWVDDQGGKGPYHLFLHHNSEDYRYFGLYACVRIEQVSKVEWRSQPDKVSQDSAYCVQWSFQLADSTGEEILGAARPLDSAWRKNSSKSFPPKIS